MNELKINNNIGKENWKFSDEIYYKLTGKTISSQYNPSIPAIIKELPEKVANKKIFALFWGSPTFKDVDCNYLFHTYDNSDIDYVISTSSGNTVEGLARAIKKYNPERNKNVKAILLVPELSSFKVASSAIENNPYIKYVVLKNSTLDSIRVFAAKLIEKMSGNYNVVSADADLKTAAYSQIGLLLNQYKLMNDDTCFVQTVSGGVGPTGFIEAAWKLNVKPELLVIQPINGNSAPTIDALNDHTLGKDPILTIKNGNYETSSIETTLGSSKPIYSVGRFVQWRENGGRIFGARVTEDELSQNKNKVLKILIEAGIYPDLELGQRFFELEKSGFIAFTGVFNSIKKIESKNIVINFTGRYLDPVSKFPEKATPHIIFNPSDGIEKFLEVLKID